MLFDSGVTHSFISYSCVGKFKLSMSSLSKDLVVETRTSGSVLTSNVCFVEAKIHGESRMIQRCFDDNNDDNKR